LYDQVDTKFTFYNPNRTYNDVTRTWSMFVGNTTLLRTVNDTLSFSSSTSSSSSHRLSTFCPLNSENNHEYLDYTPLSDETNHYDEINLDNKPEEVPSENILVHDDTRSSSYSSSSFAGGLNSDELSSATSNEYCQDEEEDIKENESIYELDLLIEQVRTCLDDLRLIDRAFSIELENIEEIINELDKMIKVQIREQTESILEIETVLGDFNFLNAIDDDETSKTIDSGFEGEQQIKQIKQDEHFKSNMNRIFVDILHRILILLHYIQNRSKSDDDLVFQRFRDQYDQLKTAISWHQNPHQNIQQILSHCDQAIIEFWSNARLNDTLIVSFHQCLSEIMKYFNCSQDVAEYLLNNLCCLPFRTNFTRPKSLTLIQIWFLLRKDRADLEAEIQLANEQINLSKNLSNLILNQNHPDISLLINRRTLNNDELFNKLLDEYQFKIPDELIGMFLPSIRHDLITHLRSSLLSHHDSPSKRLQIHKMIFNVQQMDSL
ncbi:unnamed protein product, partial [Adineta ricciae]